MADQRTQPWNFVGLGDEIESAGNDNASRTAPPDAYVVKDIDHVKRSLIDGGRQVGESFECVALVKHVLPDVGRAANWAEGSKIKGYNDPPLEPGTALATFHHGKYQNRRTGNHAGIFLGYGEDEQVGRVFTCSIRPTVSRPRHPSRHLMPAGSVRPTMRPIIR